ncbi:hypothetical protein ZIOFF_070725 [Zingiber officinale]|uniref:Uncharacterized protein n=1 Tax=Zingiber officinale TaxID=94328 RepID=A0A8J5C7H1_ZINOF|nr:hypothetical protein ZIOFF_070725 [Zingiber officinale]
MKSGPFGIDHSFHHLLLLLAVALLSLFLRVVAAARRLLSFVSLRELLLHLSFLRCGLRPVTLDLGHASLHIWGPNPRRASRKPALLLIQGFDGNSKWQWERQIGALSRSFDLYIPDLLFFSRSRSSCVDRSVGYQARYRLRGEPSLHAAVMLEQASYCYLFSIPPMLRKYGFHLVLSGNRYYIFDQRQHAIRAYRNALLVYRENGWSYISDHVHYNVGRFSILCLYICAFIFDAFDLISFHLLTWYSFIGVLDLAIKHMLEVMACSHLSLDTQNVFLNEFSHVVQSMGMKFEIYSTASLPLLQLRPFLISDSVSDFQQLIQCIISGSQKNLNSTSATFHVQQSEIPALHHFFFPCFYILKKFHPNTEYFRCAVSTAAYQKNGFHFQIS